MAKKSPVPKKKIIKDSIIKISRHEKLYRIVLEGGQIVFSRSVVFVHHESGVKIELNGRLYQDCRTPKEVKLLERELEKEYAL